MNRDLINYLDSIVGTPYVLNGRDRSGMDCLGIVILFYREHLGRELYDDTTEVPPGWYDLPEYADYIEKLIRDHAVFVETPSFGDIVLISRVQRKYINHLGVYVGEEKVLETGENRGAVITDLNRLVEIKSIKGYVRLHG